MVVMVAVAVAIAGLAKQKVHDDGRMMMNKLIFLQSNYGLHMTFQFDCPNKLVKWTNCNNFHQSSQCHISEDSFVIVIV